jgi:hypothetical protein
MRGFRSVIAVLLLKPAAFLTLVLLSVLVVSCCGLWRVLEAIYTLEDSFYDTNQR